MADAALGLIVIPLLKGFVSRDEQPKRWNELLKRQVDARAYLLVMGLDLFIDEAEGHAFVRQRREDDEDDMPRLVPRRPLSFIASLILVMLRKRMGEQDTSTGDTRLIMTKVELVDLVRPFFGAQDNEPKLMAQIERDIDRVIELGFLRGLTGRPDEYEVRRILKAFIDGEWLSTFNANLDLYRKRAAGTPENATP